MDWSSVRRKPDLSVPEQLSVDLERLILSGELKPGDRLPAERELSELLNVSRVTVRQALRELEVRGLIDRKPGRGTVVLDVSGEPFDTDSILKNGWRLIDSADLELSQVMELRGVIEPPIAALAARRVTERDIRQLERLVADMELESNLHRFGDLDRQFHQAIANYTYNPLLRMLTDLIAQEIAPSRQEASLSPQRRESSLAAHRRILEAIRSRDTEAACAEARQHVDEVLRDALNARAASSASTEGQETIA